MRHGKKGLSPAFLQVGFMKGRKKERDDHYGSKITWVSKLILFFFTWNMTHGFRPMGLEMVQV